MLSCETGKEVDGVAQYVAYKLGVEVLAPNDMLWVYSERNGVCDMTVGSKNNKQSGDFVKFVPRKDE